MSQIQQVKEATDIVEVIGQRIELKRAGAYYKGLCPFHAEKSPSFFVNEMMQRFKCFGCGKGGDAFEFLIQYENMTFYETLEYLADKAGITLERELRSRDDEERQQLLQILDITREYYHYILTKHVAGKTARAYLADRQTTSESIKLFQIGYALPQWDGLIAYLHRKKKYPLDLLMKAGLVIKGRGGRYYDRFRDRVMFPLRNSRGQVVGFSGRIMPSSSDETAKQEAKYINSPETLLYHKSKMLFGYSELHQSIREKKEIVVVEGEFDVVTSTQAHVNNVVAIKGSALTNDHALLLNRTVERVLLALDTDAAGVEATKRSLQVLKPYDLELRAVVIPEGKDPDDLARSQPKVWRETVQRSVSAYEFLIQASLKEHAGESAATQRKVIKELAPDLWGIESQVERDYYVKRLAELLKVQPNMLKHDLEHFAEKKGLATSKITKKEPTESADTAPKKLSRLEQLERYLTFLLVRGTPADAIVRLEQLEAIPVQSALLSALVKERQSLVDAETFEPLLAQIGGDLQQELMELLVDEKLSPILTSASVASEWERTMSEYEQEATKARRAAISRELAVLESTGDKTPQQAKRSDELLAELARL